MDHARRRYPQYQLPLPWNFEGFKCIFCKVKLSGLDAHRCRAKRFDRVRRGNEWFGSCTRCLEAALRLERSTFPTTLIEATPENLERVTVRPWRKLICRCYYCGSFLNHDEKLRHFLEREPFLRVRGTFKGRCSSCAGDGGRPVHSQTSAASSSL